MSDVIVVSAHLGTSEPVAQVGDPLPSWTAERAFHALTADRQRVEPRYLFWALRRRMERIKPDAHRLSARLRLSMDELLREELELPERAEQIRFVRQLDRLDMLRALRDQAEKARSALTAAVYQHWFGAASTDSWGQARLGDLVELRSVPPGAAEPDTPARDTLLVWVRGSRCGEVEVHRARSERPVPAFALRRRSPAIETLYLAETLRQADLRRFASGSVVPQLTASSLLGLMIPIPPINRQRRFSVQAGRAATLDDIAAEGFRRVDWLAAALTATAFNERPDEDGGAHPTPASADLRSTDNDVSGA
ncbi:hypothetical protein ACXY7D_18610 [Sphingomonas melonis]